MPPSQNGYSMILVIGGSAEQEHRVLAQLMRGLADGVIAVGINHLPTRKSASWPQPAAQWSFQIII